MVPLVLAAACTISKSTPTERSSAGSIGGTAADAQESRGDRLVWVDLPASPLWPAGMRLARIHGDPDSTGDFTLRISFPADYVIPAHWHPKAEQVTVLQGTFLLGMGETAERSAAQSYQPGDYVYLPGRMAHYGWTQGETVVQIHGSGPFKTYTVSAETRAQN
jgi:quercetin dioxygenase-like cupin family protein